LSNSPYNMDITITPDCLSREELLYELAVGGVKVTDTDSAESLALNLKGFFSMERDGVWFEIDAALNPDSELERCSLILEGVRELLTRVLDEPNLRVIASKLAHLRKRLSRVTVEPGAQAEQKEKLSVGTEKTVESFIPRAKYLTGTQHTSLLLGPGNFLPATSTPQPGPVDDPLSFRSYRNAAQEIGSWGITFRGDRKDDLAVFDFIVRIKEKCDSLDLPHDALRRHAKLLFKGEALIWFRMIESSVSSWTDICDRLKEEFLPIGYYDTARDKLLNYHQTAGQTIGMFLAKFDQLEGYLPRPLPFDEKMAAIRRNILPYYQDRLWDKEIVSPDELYRLCRRLDATRFNIDQHAATQRNTKTTTNRAEKATPTRDDASSRPRDVFCPRCKSTGHDVRYCPSRPEIKCFGCGKPGYKNYNCPTCKSQPGKQ
jgi:hypothetical protein